MALLDERQDRPRAVDRLAHLLEIGRGALLARGRREPALAGGEVEQRHEGLQQHVVDRDALHLGLDLPELLLGEVVGGRLGAHGTGSSCM